MGGRLFGRCWHAGDVVGCMINMEDKSMIFTLNGEILITTKGSELCFTDFETEDGEKERVWMCLLGVVEHMSLPSCAHLLKPSHVEQRALSQNNHGGDIS